MANGSLFSPQVPLQLLRLALLLFRLYHLLLNKTRPTYSFEVNELTSIDLARLRFSKFVDRDTIEGNSLSADDLGAFGAVGDEGADLDGCL